MVLLGGLDHSRGWGGGLRIPGGEQPDSVGLIEALPLWRDLLLRHDAEYHVTLKQMMNKCCKTSVYVRYPFMFTDTGEGGGVDSRGQPRNVSAPPGFVSSSDGGSGRLSACKRSFMSLQSSRDGLEGTWTFRH